MRRFGLLWLGVSCAITGSAMASDEGLQSELDELARRCFCETSLAQDMRQLMDGVYSSATAEPSPEARRKHDAMWEQIARAHSRDLQGFSGRLRLVEDDARHEMASVAWRIVQRDCAEKARHADVAYLLEAWRRAGVTTMKDKLGRRLEFTGTARNAKGGAVLVMGDEVVYLEHVDSWPEDLLGREIAVEGTLVYKKIIPDPSPGPERTAGAYGKQYVLEDPVWN